MGVITFLQSKAFKWIGTALIALLLLFFFWDKIETMLSNNTTLRQNNQTLKQQNETLKSNLETKYKQFQQELKVQEFNIKTESKKETIKKVIKKYKDNGVKHEKVDKSNPNSPVYFKL